MHFLRAYNLASGKSGNNHCVYPSDVNEKAGSIYSGNFSSNYTTKINFSETINASCGSAAGYLPLMHLPQAIGIFLGKIIFPSTAVMILLGRLFNLSFYIIIIYLIIKKVRIGKWAFVVIALFPSMVHMAASLSGDVMNNIIVFAVIAMLFNLFTQANKLTKKQIAGLLALACLASLTKATNIILLAILFLLPVKLSLKNRVKNQFFNYQKWLIIILCGILCAIFIVGWQKTYGIPLASSTLENLLLIHPLRFVKILINNYISPFIGYNDLILRGVIG